MKEARLSCKAGLLRLAFEVSPAGISRMPCAVRVVMLCRVVRPSPGKSRVRRLCHAGFWFLETLSTRFAPQRQCADRRVGGDRAADAGSLFVFRDDGLREPSDRSLRTRSAGASMCRFGDRAGGGRIGP